MALEMILQEAKGMSDESLMEVLNFMRYLKISSVKVAIDPMQQIASNGKRKIRSGGILKGKIKMASNFDDPIDDFEEYM